MVAAWLVAGAVVALCVVGLACRSGDPAERMIRHVDGLPPEERPAEWEQTKALMARRPPAVGEPAPDFTLERFDESGSVTRSDFQSVRPLVLVFGSYT